MSTRRTGTCGEPGPRAAHCTDDLGHRHSCYDAGEDVSWNEGQWYDFDLAPHDCGDPECPDQGYRGPKGRESEHGRDEERPAPEQRAHHPGCPALHTPDQPERCRCLFLAALDKPDSSGGQVIPPGAMVRITERQTWERPVVPGDDPRKDPVAARLHLEVDDAGRARVHEAVLAQLLVDAGWERTA